MGYAAKSLNDQRHKEAELCHLRDFYLMWANMHVTMSERPQDLDKCKEAAQRLTDQATKLRGFYS